MPQKKLRVDTENAAIVQRKDYSDVLRTILKEGFCPFCEEHFHKHHRRPIIFKNKHWIVTENAWPYEGARFHFLFIARTHVENIESLKPVMWSELQKLYKKLITKYHLKGASLMIRSGETKLTGASVNHLHGHLISGSARTKDSKGIHSLVGFKK